MKFLSRFSYNRLNSIPSNLFKSMPRLTSVDMRGLSISDIGVDLLAANENISYVYFDKFRYCLFVPRVRVCEPFTDGVSNLEHLLGHRLLRVSVWLVAFLTCIGNLTVLVWRSMSDSEHAVLSLFVKNLSVADFLMGKEVLLGKDTLAKF